MILFIQNFRKWKLICWGKEKRSNCLQTLGVGWGAEEGISRACETLLGGIDTCGECRHADTHHIVHFTCVWSVVGHLHVSQSVVSAGWHGLCVWSGGECIVFLLLLLPSGWTWNGRPQECGSDNTGHFSALTAHGVQVYSHCITETSP